MPLLKSYIVDRGTFVIAAEGVAISDATFELYTNNNIKIPPQGEIVFDLDLRVRNSNDDSQASLGAYTDSSEENAYQLEVLGSKRNSYKEWKNLRILLTNNSNEEYKIKKNTLIGTLNISDLEYSRKNGDDVQWNDVNTAMEELHV